MRAIWTTGGPRTGTARSTAARSGSQGTTEPDCSSAVCGSFSPWPVRTQTTRSAPWAPYFEQAGDRRGARRLAEHALAGRQQPVGVEDLLVGDRGDPPARLRHGRHRLLPARRVADPDRAGDRLGVLDPLAGDERRRAGGLEAEEPRSVAGLDEARPVRRDVARVADRDAQGVEASPSSSTSSNAAVFCPCTRYGLTEFTSAIGCLSVSSRTSSSAWSKLPRSAMTRAPCMSAWASLPVGDLAVRDDHRAPQPGPRGVGGRRWRPCCRSTRR